MRTTYTGPERRSPNRLPIIYRQSTYTPAENDEMLETLWNTLEWVRSPGLPRREYFVSKRQGTYTYGKPPHARTYSPQVWTDELMGAMCEAEHIAGCTFDAIFVNGYDNERDQLGWHSDNSPELDERRPILVMSFGAERDILFRRIPYNDGKCLSCNGSGRYDNHGSPVCSGCDGTGKETPPPDVAFRLEHGSSLIMKAGMQQTHQHRIPKASFQCGPRISLTFRGLK